MAWRPRKLERSPGALSERILENPGAVLLFGDSGGSKESLLSDLTDALEERNAEVRVVSVDLGLPIFGPPGAVSLAERREGRWRVERVEALCTLDAARFRLPLLLASKRLFRRISAECVLVDAPAATRGMAGAELLAGILAELEIRTVFLLARDDARQAPFLEELSASSAAVFEVPGAVSAPSSAARAARRTELWDVYLERSHAREMTVENLPLLGAPPPREARDAWPGRQVALVDAEGSTLAMGEVLSLEGGSLTLKARAFEGDPVAALVRDARRDPNGMLLTDRRVADAGPSAVAALEGEPSDLRAAGHLQAPPLRPPVTSLSTAKALLVNGVFGDPLLHIRLRHRRRSLLFDLGESGRLPARIVHQISDVFVSHAHFDHIGGFLWLLRTCIGSPRCRRIYGPPGLAEHIEGMMRGIRWDRIGDRGPCFEVGEVLADRLERFRLQAGRPGREPLEPTPLAGGILLDEREFRVRTATLDHGIPVLAFTFEEPRAFHIRKGELTESGIPPGPWLSELKEQLHRGALDAEIQLPTGERRRAGDLAEWLVLTRPGGKIAYATDLDDTEDNRRTLARLARGATVFYCEASFAEGDRELARATQHLTARACGEIASSAGVERLVPFHFSKRYENEPRKVYAEVSAAFPEVVRAERKGRGSRL